ncbi:tyrosine-protein phosphatase [Cohnella hongkongensis]|uniref:Tyrosine-protein phosphatase n=1 Tax=Cohnella hongkongensis TaxID=178337 RepID=A0ABV9F675_9BACL
MIDTHCHILPMCDDGPEDWERSMEMAAEAVKQGITDILATPHHGKSSYLNWPGKIDRLAAQLNDRLAAGGIALTVWPGQEYHLGAGRGGNPGAIRPLGGSRYVLIELPSRETPRAWRSALRAIRQSGYVPIVAHPERHLPFQRHPDRLGEWRDEGACFQLTAPSLLGDYGQAVQHAARRMARYGWYHLVASDAHDTGRRSFKLREACRALADLCGSDVRDLLLANSAKLLAGGTMSSGEQAKFQARPLFRFLSRRRTETREE